jgi:hypothetical protein
VANARREFQKTKRTMSDQQIKQKVSAWVFAPSFDTLETQLEEGVFVVKLNRPKRKNAINIPM